MRVLRRGMRHFSNSVKYRLQEVSAVRDDLLLESMWCLGRGAAGEDHSPPVSSIFPVLKVNKFHPHGPKRQRAVRIARCTRIMEVACRWVLPVASGSPHRNIHRCIHDAAWDAMRTVSCWQQLHRRKYPALHCAQRDECRHEVCECSESLGVAAYRTHSALVDTSPRDVHSGRGKVVGFLRGAGSSNRWTPSPSKRTEAPRNGYPTDARADLALEEAFPASFSQYFGPSLPLVSFSGVSLETPFTYKRSLFTPFLVQGLGILGKACEPPHAVSCKMDPSSDARQTGSWCRYVLRDPPAFGSWRCVRRRAR